MKKRIFIPMVLVVFVGILVSIGLFVFKEDNSNEDLVDTTLVQRETNYSDLTYLDNCSSDYSFYINSNEKITNSNLYDYVIVLNCFNEPVVLGVEEQNNKYLIYSKGYTCGETYKVILADTVFFDNTSISVRERTFSIGREETYISTLNDDCLTIDEDKVIDYLVEENILILQKDLYVVDDLIKIVNNLTNDFVMYKVLEVLADEEFSKLLVDEAGVEDVYSELDIYTRQELDCAELDLSSIDTTSIENKVKETETYAKICMAAINVNELDKCRILNTSEAKTIIDKIKVKATLSGSKDGIKATITLSYSDNTKMWGNVSIKLVFEPMVKIDIKASAKLDIKFLIWNSKLNFDFSLTTTTTTEITLTILVENDSATLKKKIENSLKDNTTSAAEKIKEYFNKLDVKGNEVSYTIPIPSFNIPYTPLTINLDVTLFINFAFKVELITHQTFVLTNVNGIRTTSNGIELYSSSNSNYTFDDLTLSGQASVKAGVRLSAYLSVIGLRKNVQIGVSGEIGAYADFTGELAITNNEENGLDSNFKYYLEAGVYASANAFYKFFSKKDSKTLFESKFPLLKQGNQTEVIGVIAPDEIELKSKISHLKTKAIIKEQLINLISLEETTDIIDFNDYNLSLQSGQYIEINDELELKINPEAPSVVEDCLIIELKKDKNINKKIKLKYIDKASLDGLVNDNGVVYELDFSNNTYSLVSAPKTIVEYDVLSNILSFPVIKIEAMAFYNCSKLTRISLGNVSIIEEAAFYNCTSLKMIDLKNVTKVSDNAFKKCQSLNKVDNISFDVISDNTFYGCVNLLSIKLPTNLKTIGTYAFYETGINTIVIPSSVTEINNCAFGGSEKLHIIIFDGMLPSITGDLAFNVSNRLHIYVNDLYLESYQNSLYKFKNVINSNAIIIDDYIIGEKEGNYGIISYYGIDKEVNVPSVIASHTISFIGEYAFTGMITNVNLPETITSIEAHAFNECIALNKITLNSTSVPSLGVAFIWGTPDSLKIYVKLNILPKYVASTQWSYYSSQIKTFE